ncbi:hypothetical protein GWI33_000422 [Rhynchophorus ferrugineus]|uniref:Uncharacterized protein n=1 Tax=Rhynchophorus ferrugineus TaxID=354439 RepID=A0A834HR30_RHYFE|nr:hypothetical protein GWI33_000430 [Rhynchophorus ferrugineus]KAF7264250.1 hypothetical protein GWI33_000425 [Rhynchophorus ferrugineus]KAF7264258.1 hypothetical protein GWI33_000422 [Rhynchophorus ferrugineus]
MLILLQCFGLLLPLTYGAKILGVFMTPSHSHQVIFQSIWKELSLRGHQVTVYTPFPLRDESLTNLTEYDLSFTYDLLKEISDFGKDISADGNIYHMLKMLKVITDAQLEHQSMQDLIKNPNNETYDLFLVEYIWQSYFAFKDIYKVPMVGVLSLPPTVNMADSLGLDKHPIVDPELMLHFSQAKTFKERLQSWMTKWIFRIFHRTKFQPLYNEQLVKYFNVDTPSYELAKDASLLIGSFNFGIYNAKPRFANYIPVNSLHIHPPKPLPDVMQSAKILGVFMAASYSHQNMFRPIWNELALRGHQLTIYTTFPLKNESITNLIEYDFEFCIRLKENRSNFERPSRLGNLLEVIGVMRDTTEAQLQHPFMTDLIHNVRNESFDLILVEHYWQTYFALKDVYKAPMVGITSFPLTIPTLDGLGLERHPCIEPDMLLKFSEPNTFIKRLISWSFNWAFRFFYDIYFRAMFDDQIRRYFGNTSRTSSELSREFSLVIGQSNIALVNSVTTSRNFIPVSSIHVKPEKPLPEVSCAIIMCFRK